MTDLEEERNFGFATRALHAGQPPDASTGSRAQPIYQTTSYVFDDTEDAAALFALQKFGNIYSRIMNPTNAVLEERVASLEGGVGALATSSGHSAQLLAFLTLLEHGDHLVASASLYGGSVNQLNVTLRRMGIETTFVDPDDIDAFRKAITPKTKAVYVETIANPRMTVIDLEAVAKVAHEADLPLIVDNTCATPYLCRPFDHGANVITHSATKFLGGHGTTIAGVLVDGGNFAWDNGKHPTMTEPSAGYHGMRYHETFGQQAYIIKARTEGLRDLGPSLSPMNAFLVLQGIETLPIRMERHVAHAVTVANFLEQHPLVSWVRYPGLKTSPYYALAQKYLPAGAGAVLAFGVKGGYETGRAMIDHLQLFSHVANVGDAKSLVLHPASTTHQQLSLAEQEAAGVTADMLRLSIGLESVDDLLWDLEQALRKSQQKSAAAAD